MHRTKCSVPNRLARLMSLLWIATVGSGAHLEVASASDSQAEGRPTNAVAKRYGAGWDCKHGFHEQGANCVAVSPPDHAFLDSHGHEWKCDRGFVKEGSG